MLDENIPQRNKQNNACDLQLKLSVRLVVGALHLQKVVFALDFTEPFATVSISVRVWDDRSTRLGALGVFTARNEHIAFGIT